jgi:hypothetical protein
VSDDNNEGYRQKIGHCCIFLLAAVGLLMAGCKPSWLDANGVPIGEPSGFSAKDVQRQNTYRAAEIAEERLRANYQISLTALANAKKYATDASVIQKAQDAVDAAHTALLIRPR